MKSLFDRSFHYTPAVKTDIRKTFARARREMREKELQPSATVTPLLRKPNGRQ